MGVRFWSLVFWFQACLLQRFRFSGFGAGSGVYGLVCLMLRGSGFRVVKRASGLGCVDYVNSSQ